MATTIKNVNSQMQRVLKELTDLQEKVCDMYKAKEQKAGMETPFQTFVYKIDWIKDQLKSDYSCWIADCEIAKAEQFKNSLDSGFDYKMRLND